MKGLFLVFFALSCATEEAIYELTQADVDNVIKSQLENISACYQHGLKDDKNLRGNFILSWKVNPKGVVEDVRIKSTDAPVAGVADCVLEYSKNWRFPMMGGERNAHVEFPFSMNP